MVQNCVLLYQSHLNKFPYIFTLTNRELSLNLFCTYAPVQTTITLW